VVGDRGAAVAVHNCGWHVREKPDKGDGKRGAEQNEQRRYRKSLLAQRGKLSAATGETGCSCCVVSSPALRCGGTRKKPWEYLVVSLSKAECLLPGRQFGVSLHPRARKRSTLCEIRETSQAPLSSAIIGRSMG